MTLNCLKASKSLSVCVVFLLHKVKNNQTVAPLASTGYLESNFNCFRLIPGNYKRLTMTMAAIPAGVTRAGVASVSG